MIRLLPLLVAAGLVVLAGAFAMTDAAVSEISPARVGELEREQVRGARSLRAVVAEAPRHLSLLILLRLICELTATMTVALVAVDTWGVGWRAALVTVGAMTVVSFAIVGVGPRTLGRQHAYAVALTTAGAVRWLGRVLGPLTRLLILVGNAITPGRGFREGPFASQVELRELVELAERRGVVEHGEREMINSVFALGDTIAREVMVPRTEVVFIESTKTLKQALALALRSGFSRIPVVGQNVDDIVGLVYLKDVVRRMQGEHDPERQQRVCDVMRPAEFVPESKPVDDLLREMQAHRIHMVVVIDEYGGTAGLVTIEDVLEEIVGEIADEYDDEKPPVEQLPDGRARITARSPVELLRDLFDVEIEGDDVETVGGLLAEALGRVPIPGATARVQGLELVAENAGGRRNRIDTVLVRRLTEEQPDDAPRQEGAPIGSNPETEHVDV
jgi:CBS domain containing-hemolysin-like protein